MVLRRDNWVCRIVTGCAHPATVADHIIPVFPGMPDAMFFNPKNVRAACRDHNLARAWAEKLATNADQSSDVVTTDYSRRSDGSA
jgi:5-methylcytosine-specific restriction endonuclease McrA